MVDVVILSKMQSFVSTSLHMYRRYQSENLSTDLSIITLIDMFLIS